MKFADKIKSFVKPRLTRLLFLATLLVVFNASRLAALAKYNTYINDYTSAVAGDFFFRSNYLFEAEEKAENYQITNWDGKEFNIELSIFNFENAYRYNQAGTDFLYTVRVEAFTDAACTNPDGYFDTLTVEYKNGVDATCEDWIPKPDDPYTYEKKTVDCAISRGLAAYSKDAGTSTVYVKTGRTEEFKDPGMSRYIKVTAHTIPLEWMEEPGRVQYKTGIEPITTKEGIYYSEISAIFQLTRPSGSSSVIANYIPGSDNSRTLRLMCKSSETGSAEVRVYYDHTKLQPTEEMGTYSTERRNNSDFVGWRYITANVKLGASVDVTFNKIDPTADITYDPGKTGPARTENSLGFDVYTREGGEEEIKYNIGKYATESNGHVVSIKAKGESGQIEDIIEAPEGRVIYVATEADEGYERNGLKLHHSDDVGNIIVSESEGVYSFKMPAAAVEVEGLFKEKEIPPATESEPERATESEPEKATDSEL